ncbi:FtsW/RodA/SpoVE family cell cycle protein [Anaerobaca lacustris]|uniref:Cell wall polymerase n=1 Tax=Anaerobaca lacustris TaxID=3044600 RepID=A0AAW6U3L1_9BACT|nr:FtsW/RodA/SpoVE family cell cycle protein [Sedimentisphaerales bacterium M17dextr]
MLNFLKGRLLPVRICLLASMVALVAIGVATIYIVGHPEEPSPASDAAELAGYWKKQLVFAVVGLGGLVAANLVNYRRLGAVSHWIYGVTVVLLVVILVGKYVSLPFVPQRGGAYRWIVFKIGSHSLPAIQPSEFCKLAYILALAWYLRYRSNYSRFRSLVGPFALTLLPMVLILLEPDLGTVLLMMPVFFTMLFVAGARIKHLAMIVLLAVVVSPAMWFMLRPYQRMRISSVLLQSQWVRQKAEQSPTVGRLLVGGRFTERRWRNDWGYHLVRSKFAVASGGWSGAGYGRGPFIKYDFLPERHNDFIFSVIAHQWGFIGCLGFLLLYVLLVACGLEIAVHNTDPFGRLMAMGIVAMFVVEVATNVGMTLGLMPITGMTLPFVSYGGSSLLVNMMAVGLLNNVGRCRPFSVAPRKGIEA